MLFCWGEVFLSCENEHVLLAFGDFVALLSCDLFWGLVLLGLFLFFFGRFFSNFLGRERRGAFQINIWLPFLEGLKGIILEQIQVAFLGRQGGLVIFFRGGERFEACGECGICFSFWL